MGEREHRRGGGVAEKLGEGERDGAFDREEGMADTSGSHHGVSVNKRIKNLSYSKLNDY
jgi:hypothetical protein